MKEQISFAEYIKNEILEFNWEEPQLDILFYSFLRANGNFKKTKFEVCTSIKNKKELIQSFFKKFYNVEPEIKELETKVKFIVDEVNFTSKLEDKWKDFKPKNDMDSRAYIAGAFLAKGWSSRPSSKFYHMEFRIGSLEHANLIEKAMNSFEIQSKKTHKNDWYIIYVKKSIHLSELMSLMGAQQARMIFEDERISRTITSSYAKMTALEPYNALKTERIAKKQIASINKLKGTPSWNALNENIKLVAEIRLEKPDLSLSDIQYVFNLRKEMDVSKSTINNWFKIIVDLAE